MGDDCGVLCNRLGSSRKVQAQYVMVVCIYLLFAIVHTITEFVTDLNMNLQVLDHLIVLITAISFWVLVSSRCLAPCCCPTKTADVPDPCPPSPGKLLDYPLIILFAGQGWVGICEALLMLLASSADEVNMRMWRLLKLGLILVGLVGLCTGLIKWKLMGKQIEDPADEKTQAGIVGDVQAVRDNVYI